MNDLGNKIRNYRKKYGLSQFELENKMDTSVGTICRIEKGTINPTKETILKLADALELNSTEKADLLSLRIFAAEEAITALNKVSSNFNLQSILQASVDVVYDLYSNYDGAVIFLAEEKNPQIISIKTVTNVPKIQKAVQLLGKSLFKLKLSTKINRDNFLIKAFVEGKPYISNDINDFSKGMFSKIIATSMVAISGFQNGIAVPIKFQDQPIGSILFTKRTLDDFTTDEVKILELIADQFGITIKKAFLFENSN